MMLDHEFWSFREFWRGLKSFPEWSSSFGEWLSSFDEFCRGLERFGEWEAEGSKRRWRIFCRETRFGEVWRGLGRFGEVWRGLENRGLERFGEVCGGLESGKVVFGTGRVVLESFDEF